MFYGWLVLLACMAAAFASAPGHSFGINEFIDYFIRDLGTTRTNISMLWLVASSFSGALVGPAGAFLDRYGSRRMLLSVLVPYISALIFLRYVNSMVTLCLLISVVRFLGPECLMLVANTTVNIWFVRQRGKATATFGIVKFLFFSEPIMIGALIKLAGWRNAYGIIAGICGLLLALAICFVRDSPEKCGLLPDGDSTSDVKGQQDAQKIGDASAAVISETDELIAEKKESTGIDQRVPQEAATSTALELEGATLGWTLRQPMYWSITLTNVCGWSAWAGMNYHISDIVHEQTSMPADKTAAAVYTPLSSISLPVSFLLGVLVVDRISPQTLIRGLVLSRVLLGPILLFVLYMRTEADVWLFASLWGIQNGCQSAFTDVLFATLFGRRSLGKINGFSSGMALASSGVGVVLFGMLKDLTTSYTLVIKIWACGIVASSLLFLCSRVPDWRHADVTPEARNRLPDKLATVELHTPTSFGSRHTETCDESLEQDGTV